MDFNAGSSVGRRWAKPLAASGQLHGHHWAGSHGRRHLADFDVIKQQLVNARLADGTPIPVTELRELAVGADILPSIFNSKTQNLWLGRSRRTASEAQRIALTARDEHCIGCQANPLWCRAHHIIWWSHDGKTDFNNLLLVCDGCHHKIHDQGWQVHQHPKTRKFYLKPPTNPD